MGSASVLSSTTSGFFAIAEPRSSAKQVPVTVFTVALAEIYPQMEAKVASAACLI